MILFLPVCSDKSSFEEILNADLNFYLEELLSEPTARYLREMAPTHFQLGKRKVVIHYDLDKTTLD